MNVLSLFDGISAGQLALKRANKKIKNYYSSEIDKDAIYVTNKNFPNTIQLGNVEQWKDWNLPNIDLLLAGSPCNNLSTSSIERGSLGLRGKDSSLFFYFIDILNEIKPKYFIFENISKMKKEHLNKINEMINCKPIKINSSLVSGQNRVRFYWTNINVDYMPTDKEIKLRDIIIKDDDIKNQLRISDKGIALMNRVYANGKNNWDYYRHSDTKNDKSNCVMANFKKGAPSNVLVDGECIRQFHPVEAERLQTFPDNYTEGLHKTNRFKVIGNSWTVDIIAHILSFIPL